MPKLKIRARYKVLPPKMVTRMRTIVKIDPETKVSSYEKVPITEKMWVVLFPQGHSVRFNEKNLKYHNLHLKPRLVDMNTGDILDEGGDPYDLENIEDRNDFEVDEELDEEDTLIREAIAENSASKRKQTEKVE